MTYRVDTASRRVEKQILSLPYKLRNEVVKKILLLGKEPRPGGIIKISGNIYRLRIGKYRVIYEIDDKHNLVIVTKVDKRRERTYKGLK